MKQLKKHVKFHFFFYFFINLAPWRVLVPLQVGVASQKKKARLNSCFNITSRFRFLVPNQCAALDGILTPFGWNLALASMESRTKVSREYSLSADAMCGRATITYNSQSELIPYQTLRSWINKKTNRSSSFYFGGACLTKVEPNFIWFCSIIELRIKIFLCGAVPVRAIVYVNIQFRI